MTPPLADAMQRHPIDHSTRRKLADRLHPRSKSFKRAADRFNGGLIGAAGDHDTVKCRRPVLKREPKIPVSSAAEETKLIGRGPEYVSSLPGPLWHDGIREGGAQTLRRG